MKTLKFIATILIYLLGAFFIMMSFDAFSDDGTVWELILGFLIHSSPGIGIILVNYLLRKQELILGMIYIVASIVFFILFKFYREFLDKILTIIVVMTPTIFSGIVFIISGKQKLKSKSEKT